MKVAVGSRPFSGPWGGGNRFATSLYDALRGANHVVTHDLTDRDIDVILLTDPRVRAPNVCFGAGEVLRYVTFRNPNAIVIHRINECDERKNERFINDKLVRANYIADATVFVGEWLTQLPVWRENLRSPWFVIRNGADARLFNRKNFSPWRGQGRLKLVTHHWGYHLMKGFDVYEVLDRMLTLDPWRDRIAFTFVGNLPKGFSFTTARHVAPLDGDALVTELSEHHAYLTASINEPGGNHQNEGALCGLPLLYRNSGCFPEYCRGFGVAFDGLADFPAKLDQFIEDYPNLVGKMPGYPHTAEAMTHQWIGLFENLLAQRDNIIKSRPRKSNLWRALVTQLPW